jgi:hypothetical protein
MDKSAIGSIWITIALLPGAACAANPPCQELEGSTPPQQVQYLQAVRSGLRTECVALAITRLGQEAYVPSADVLTLYLDFSVAKPKFVPLDFDRLPWMEEYPAAHALYAIGLPAAGSLVRAIGRANSSDLLRTNAEEVLLAIHREDPGGAVRALRQSSKSSSDPVASSRLFESATKLSRKCAQIFRSACETALN